MKLKKMTSKSGLTLVEVLVAVLILLPLFTVGMQAFIKCIELSDLAKNSSLAVWGSKNQVAAIEKTAYAQIAGTFNNTTFTIAGLTGIGKVYVDTVGNHLVVTCSFSWRERSGRIIGEDKNLNGVWNNGEDTITANNRLDSIVQVSTQIFDI